MAAPTKPFNQQDGMNTRVVAPGGFSKYALADTAVLTVTFQALTRYIRIAADAKVDVAWNAAGLAADAYNSVGGTTWPASLPLPGQHRQLYLSNTSGGPAVVNLYVVHGTDPAAVMGDDFSLYEGALVPHTAV
jgi:hypothetical protein